MAYHKQKQRVLAGSLNLLPPADKIADEDSLALLNWRVDQQGQLRSRRAIHPLSPALSGGTIHTIYAEGIQNYAGVGANLYGGSDFSTLLGTGFSGAPLGVVTYGGFVWFMDASKQSKTQFPWAVVQGWTPPTPASAPTGTATGTGGGLTGVFTYWVTFDTDYGHESNPSVASATVTCSAAASVSLTGIPVSSDAQVTKRRIYRSGGGADPLRVGTINNNTATTFSDTMLVADAITIGTAMEVDHDPAPACKGLAGPYFGKLIAFNSAAHPNRIWWTSTARPWYFPGSNDDSEGNWEDVGEDGEAVITVTLHKQMMIVYKERSIWRYVGDPDTNSPVQTNSMVGITGGPRAVVTLGTMDYFEGAEGIYCFNGDFEQKISQKLEPLFHDEWTEIGNSLYSYPMTLDYRRTCVMGAKNGRLYFSYPENSGAGPLTPTAVLVYDIAQQRWYQESISSSLGGTAFTALFYEGHLGSMYGGLGNKIYEIDSGYYDGHYSDGGQPLSLLWQSKFLDQGLPDNPKVYADLVIDYRTATAEIAQTAATLNVRLLFDYGAAQTIGTISSGTRTTAVFGLGTNGEGITGRNVAVRIDGTTFANVIIYGVYIHFYVEARAGRTFDTGVIPLGTWRDKQIDGIELDLVSAAALTPRLYTDLTGGAMAQRWTVSVAATATRSVLRQTFAPVDARKMRLTGVSASPFQLWGLRVRQRPIAAFVDGTQGEAYETRPIGLGGSGFENVELFRELEFDIETSPGSSCGQVRGEIWTDLPGDAMTFRYGFWIDTDPTHQRPINVRLPGNVKGRQYKLRILPPIGAWARVYGARVFAKSVGTAETAPWAWKPVPLLDTPPMFEWVDLPVDAIE